MDDLSLFGDDPAPASSPAPKGAEKWQTDLIRQALDSHGLTTQQARRDKIVAVVRRDVTSLADLTTDEAGHLLIELGREGTTTRTTESLWESREEDTWIDRL